MGGWGHAVRVINNGVVFSIVCFGSVFGLSRSFVVCSFVRVRSGRSVGFLFESTVRRPS